MNKQNSDLEKKVIAILSTLYDPEIPVNIVDLGLIYEISIKNNNVHIQMTLTNPACPIASEFPNEVKNAIKTLSEVNEVFVELVWDPPWTTDRLSPAAKLQLGL